MKNLHFDTKNGATSGLGEGGATSDPQIVGKGITKLCAKFQIKIRKTVENLKWSVLARTTPTTETCRS